MSIATNHANTVLTLSHRDFVRSYCWLVNFSGRRYGFSSIDLAQEHNVRDIKVSGSSVSNIND